MKLIAPLHFIFTTFSFYLFYLEFSFILLILSYYFKSMSIILLSQLSFLLFLVQFKIFFHLIYKMENLLQPMRQYFLSLQLSQLHLIFRLNLKIIKFEFLYNHVLILHQYIPNKDLESMHLLR